MLLLLADGWNGAPSRRGWLFGLGVMGFAIALPILRPYTEKITNTPR
jgi:hypothetical protein